MALQLYSRAISLRYKGYEMGRKKNKRAACSRQISIQAIINNNAHTIVTPNRVRIRSISEHALDRVNDPTRHVTAKQIRNALTKPLHIDKIKTDKQGRASQRYIGSEATVNVNPISGVIITVWKTGKKQKKKYGGKGVT